MLSAAAQYKQVVALSAGLVAVSFSLRKMASAGCLSSAFPLVRFTSFSIHEHNDDRKTFGCALVATKAEATAYL